MSAVFQERILVGLVVGRWSANAVRATATITPRLHEDLLDAVARYLVLRDSPDFDRIRQFTVTHNRLPGDFDA